MTSVETPRSIATDGGSVVHTPVALGRLRQPYRNHIVAGRAGTPDVYVLPLAAGAFLTTKLGLGVPVGTVIRVFNFNGGGHAVTIRNEDSTFSINVAANTCSSFLLYSSATAAGSWTTLAHARTAGRGTSQPNGFLFSLDLRYSQNNVEVLREAIDAGYDGTEPALVRVRVRPNVVLGSAVLGTFSLDMGGDAAIGGINWHASSAFFLQNEGVIAGYPGAGGSGGIGGTGAATGVDGEDGGCALRARYSLVINNTGGTIQGGGGGGGGGDGDILTSGLHGGGGGGGSGANVDSTGTVRGGVGGTAGTGAQAGVDGNLFIAGAYGVGSLVTPDIGGRGGVGGTPANSGDQGQLLNNAGNSSSGGVAGPAISRHTSATVTFSVAGTVTGATVVA